nr:GGDEF domain-containing protein [uncultured Rhodoferax sp.]
MSDSDQTTVQSSAGNRLFSSAPTSGPSDCLCSKSESDISSATLLLFIQNLRCCIDRLNPRHDAGDAVLQTIAARLKENTRDDDTVSRLGGDEFLYLLMGATDEPTIANLAQKIVNRVQLPCQLDTGDISVFLSIGIALFPRHGTTADSLIKEADAAMYVAKRDRTGYAFAK